MCGLLYNYFIFLTVKEMRHKFMSDNTHQGLERAFCRDHVYEDVIEAYQDNLEEILKEFPFQVRYIKEKAVDIGGVCLDLFSTFWEDSDVKNFDGEKLLVPAVRPNTNKAVLRLHGTILSHGFMVCGFLPIRIAFLSLLPYFLGLKWRCQTASSSILSSTTWPLMTVLSSARLLQKLKQQPVALHFAGANHLHSKLHGLRPSSNTCKPKRGCSVDSETSLSWEATWSLIHNAFRCAQAFPSILSEDDRE